MGNNNSPSSKGSIQILLKSCIYLPGQVIEGNLQLKSTKQFKFGKILYQVHQTEYWKNRSNEINPNQTKVSTIIQEYPDLIKKDLQNGISIPFSILLPNYILPSFEYSLVDKQGFIRTQVFVNIEEFEISSSVFIIIQKPPMVLTTPLTMTCKDDSKVLGLVDKILKSKEKKEVGIEASYPANNYSFFDTIPITIKLENSRSKLKVKKVLCELKRRIKFKNFSKEEKNLTWVETVVKNELTVTNQDQTFNVQIMVIEDEQMYNRYVLNKTNLNIVDKRQIINFLPSFSSSMLSCEYFIHVESVFDQIIPFIKNLTIDLPVSITHYTNNFNGNGMIMNSNMQTYNNQFNQQLYQFNGLASSIYPMAPQMSQIPNIGQQPLQMSQIPNMDQQQPQMQTPQINQIPNMEQQPPQMQAFPSEEQVLNQQQQQNNNLDVPPSASGYPSI